MILPINYIIGISALVFMILTILASTTFKMKFFKYHKILAIITFILALIHAFLALKGFF